jgi:hypothetical protein
METDSLVKRYRSMVIGKNPRGGGVAGQANLATPGDYMRRGGKAAITTSPNGRDDGFPFAPAQKLLSAAVCGWAGAA